MKTILTLSVEAMKEQPVPLVEIPEAEEDLYVRTCPQKLQQEVIHKKDTIRIREDLNLPPGRPNIHRILWKEVRVQGTEVRPEEGKFIVKGELLVFFLYESAGRGKRLQWIEQGISLLKEVACEECRADLTGKRRLHCRRPNWNFSQILTGNQGMYVWMWCWICACGILKTDLRSAGGCI